LPPATAIPIRSSRIKLLPGILEQTLLGKGVLGVEMSSFERGFLVFK